MKTQQHLAYWQVLKLSPNYYAMSANWPLLTPVSWLPRGTQINKGHSVAVKPPPSPPSPLCHLHPTTVKQGRPCVSANPQHASIGPVTNCSGHHANCPTTQPAVSPLTGDGLRSKWTGGYVAIYSCKSRFSSQSHRLAWLSIKLSYGSKWPLFFPWKKGSLLTSSTNNFYSTLCGRSGQVWWWTDFPPSQKTRGWTSQLWPKVKWMDIIHEQKRS